MDDVEQKLPYIIGGIILIALVIGVYQRFRADQKKAGKSENRVLNRIDQFLDWLGTLKGRLDNFQQDVLVFIIFPPFLYFLLRFVFYMLNSAHPIAGLAWSIWIIGSTIYVLKNYSKDDDVELFGKTVPHVLSVFGIIIVSALAGFSCLSYSLYELGWAQYISDEPLSLNAMAKHYFWNLINIIPGLEVWKTLKVDDPLPVSGWRAGILLLCFKVIVIVPFIALVKRWWDDRKKKAAGREEEKKNAQTRK